MGPRQSLSRRGGTGRLTIPGPATPLPANPAAAPIIVTATMGAADQRAFDALRQRHFPPERNHLAAHITLFHHLPPARLDELRDLLRSLARGPAPAARIDAIVNLGLGTAFRIDSPDLLALRAVIADRFAADLIPQDRATPRLHITVQNKVDPAAARALVAALSADFAPRPLCITGLAMHWYRGGPWQFIAGHRFRGAARAG